MFDVDVWFREPISAVAPREPDVILIPQEGMYCGVTLPLRDATRLELVRNFVSDMGLPCNGDAATEAANDIYFPVPMVTSRDLASVLPLALESPSAPTVEDIVDDEGIDAALQLLRVADYLGATELLTQYETWLEKLLAVADTQLLDALRRAFPAEPTTQSEKQTESKQSLFEQTTEPTLPMGDARHSPATPLLGEIFGDMAMTSFEDGVFRDNDAIGSSSPLVASRKRSATEAMLDANDGDGGAISLLVPTGPLHNAFARLPWHCVAALLEVAPELADVWGTKAGTVGGPDVAALAQRFPDTTVVDCWGTLPEPTPDAKLPEIINGGLLKRVDTLRIYVASTTISGMLQQLELNKRRQIRTLVVLDAAMNKDMSGTFAVILPLFPKLRTLAFECGTVFAPLNFIAMQRRQLSQEADDGKPTEWCQEVTALGDNRVSIAPLSQVRASLDRFWAQRDFMPTIQGMTPAVFALSQGYQPDFEQLVCSNRVGTDANALLQAVSTVSFGERGQGTGCLDKLRLYCRLLRHLAERRNEICAKRVRFLSETADAIADGLNLAMPDDRRLLMELLVLLCSFMTTSARVSHLFGRGWEEMQQPNGQSVVLPWLYIAEKTLGQDTSADPPAGYATYPLTLACLTERFTTTFNGRLRHGCTFWHCLNDLHLGKIQRLVGVLPACERALVAKPWEANDYGQVPLMGKFSCVIRGGNLNPISAGGFDVLLAYYGFVDVTQRPSVDDALSVVDNSGKTIMHYLLRETLKNTGAIPPATTTTLFERQIYERCHAIRDRSGRTPLQMVLNVASLYRQERVIALIDKVLCALPSSAKTSPPSASVGCDTVDDLLHYFASSVDEQRIFLRLLLRAGPCVRMWRDANGNNLAHHLALCHHRSLVHTMMRWLAVAGVSLVARNDDGHTPLDLLRARRELVPRHLTESVTLTRKLTSRGLIKTWCQAMVIAPNEANGVYDLFELALTCNFGRELPANIVEAIETSSMWHRQRHGQFVSQTVSSFQSRGAFLCQFLTDLGFSYSSVYGLF